MPDKIVNHFVLADGSVARYDYDGLLNAPAIEGNIETYQAYWTESLSGAIGGNIYKCSEFVIPAGTELVDVRYKAEQIPNGYMYILSENNVILDKRVLTSSTGWNVESFGNEYDVDVYIAVSGCGIANTYSTAEHSPLYSVGLYEAQTAENNKVIGDTITFAHNVPTRYYAFGIEITIKEKGIASEIESMHSELDIVSGKITPDDFTMPRCIKVNGQYTLVGRWFNHRLDDTRFNNCCNCGGQSIMFKVKGATTITANFGQVSRYPDNSDYFMVNEPYMAYSIDGASWTRVQMDTTNGNTISVADTNEHFVWIVVDGMDMVTKNGVSRPSGWVGVYIKDISSNGTMYAVEPTNKQILFVGDSMIEGINTLGTTSTAPANSAVNEFSFKTAQKLNAIPLLNGYGGTTTWTGVDWVRYSFGTTSSDVVTMTPDIIVIEYGHNDNSVINAGTHTVAEFIAQYELLIDILRGLYTGVPIICMIPLKQYLASAIRTVVSSKQNCYLVETSSYNVTYSDGTHPDANGATNVADGLSADIMSIIGKPYFI